jgi:spectinomycin phosphotransferase
MLTPPSEVGEGAVRAGLESGWGMRVAGLDHVPLGAGSHHWAASDAGGVAWFVTLDDVRTKPWLGDDVALATRRLDAALGVAVRLRDLPGIDVVAPVVTRDGRPTHGVAEGWALSVTPWISGTAGSFAVSWPSGGRVSMLEQLAALHGSRLPEGLHRITLLPERVGLRTVLDDLAGPWPGGPWSESARLWLLAHAEEVRHRLDDLEALEAALGDRPLVVTHGEPHPGNVLVDGERLRLVDWDTAGLAPPERDLWWFRDGDLSAWSALTGMPVDTRAMAAYALAWTLADVASYVGQLRRPHADTRDSRAAYHWLAAVDLG